MVRKSWQLLVRTHIAFFFFYFRVDGRKSCRTLHMLVEHLLSTLSKYMGRFLYS